MKNIYNQTIESLQKYLRTKKEKPYRAQQIFKWLYIKFADSFDCMTDIGKTFREILKQDFYFPDMNIGDAIVSKDNSIKFLLPVEDNYNIESVYMPTTRRRTICISTQLGCKYKCKYCITGTRGFIRNLSVAEILLQLIKIQKYIGIEKRITHIVFMGMGEPLDNYDNVMQSISILKKSIGFNYASRKITLSTCGVVDKLKKLSEQTVEFNLAVSLNAVTDEKRDFLMPINKKYDLKKLIQVLQQIRFKNRLHLTLEYIMIKDFNIFPEDAVKLVQIAQKLDAKINLISLNPNQNSDLNIPAETDYMKFYNLVKEQKVKCTIRVSRGQDINAACGQLMQRMVK